MDDKLNLAGEMMSPNVNNGNYYSVFVGSIEVNDYQLSLDNANQLADTYKEDGYDDVSIFDARKEAYIS